MYESCMLSTLLYGAECWNITELDLCRPAAFHTTKPRKDSENLLALEKIFTDKLLRQAKDEDICSILVKRRWGWIGHAF